MSLILWGDFSAWKLLVNNKRIEEARNINKKSRGFKAIVKDHRS
jgi:hypothetical protein